MRIVLLRGGETFWGRVEAYLQAINVRPEIVDDPSQVRAGGKRPDLIIAGPQLAGHQVLRGLSVPRMVIDDSGAAAADLAGIGRPEPTILSWPCTRGVFLEATAALLKIEPRKPFRAMIRVGLRGQEQMSLAESRDYSLSGMSFSSQGYFAEGARIGLSVSPPDQPERLMLEARVVRTFRDESDGAMVFGVEFFGLDPRRRELLRRFVLS